MNLKEAHNLVITNLLVLYENREASNIADMLTEHITGLNRTDRMIHKNTALTALQTAEYCKATDRLLKHEPIQYIIAKAWFYKYPFYVNNHVLIPRPETEELVANIINENATTQPSILDIGTGSGCIAISLKKNLEATVTAIDVIKETLLVAEKNATDLNTVIHFKQLNFLDTSQWNSLGMFDIIVSNPPYIKFEEQDEMRNNVLQHEPHLALFVENDDPLIFYRMIAEFGKTHSHKNGSIWMEINEALGNQTKELMEQYGYQAAIIKDIQGKDRMIKAILITSS